MARYTIDSGSIKAEDLGNGKRRLVEAFRCSIDGERYDIPAGFVWDGASVPRPFWAAFGHPYDRIHDKPGLWHDAAYSGLFAARGIDRSKADEIYRAWIRANGATWTQARLEWLAIRLCGASHYAKIAAVALAVAIAGCAGCSVIDRYGADWFGDDSAVVIDRWGACDECDESAPCGDCRE